MIPSSVRRTPGRPRRSAAAAPARPHVNGEERTPGKDLAAVEEPLQVRVNGEPLAVIMRTPGATASLVAGFLLSEGVIRGRADLDGSASCSAVPRTATPTTSRTCCCARLG